MVIVIGGAMDNGFNILERLIHLTNLRHGVISSNIANADTPDYKAKDLKFEQLLNDELLELKTTCAHHIKNIDLSLSEEVSTDSGQQWADRNDVQLDMEVAKMTENALLFQAALNMFSTKARMFKNALRR
jgi:flagellar basal-body rod protein FlgB